LTLAKSPLTFTPQKGGISLFSKDVQEKTPRQRTESPGPINLFDSNPYENLRLTQREKTVQEKLPVEHEAGNDHVGGGIWAPKITDTEFEFDWPNDEIKKACEEFFVEDSGTELPALNWIPVDNGKGENKGVIVDEMEVDIMN
jgi:hypothetical protein